MGAKQRYVKGLAPGLPSAIKVGPFVYTVRKWKRLPSENSGAWGMCDTGTTVILIAETTSHQKQREVLLHEVLHAIFGVTGLCHKDGSPEELVVTDMSPTLLQVLRDNPDLVAFLTAKE